MAPLPLFNSLTHLSYLTSTSPRIREIMTQDGGLERLVRMLHDYCLTPAPPENPGLIYGLTPPNSRPPKPGPILNPTSFDKHAAYRFSLAFQCVVNIGVRGSEHIRSRVVQAGTLDVVGCILEAWLASKGFAVGPSQSATGLPRETKEQRQARKAAQLEARQREEAVQLQRALQQTQRMLRQDNRTLRPLDTRYRDDDAMDISPSPSPGARSLIDRSSHSSTPGANSDTDMSADNSIATTPLGSGTPTSSVVIPNRDRSGTLVARPWDRGAARQPSASSAGDAPRHRPRQQRSNASLASSTDNSRPETETEDDGEPDADVDMDRDTSTSVSPPPERPHRNLRLSTARRPVGIVSNDPPTVPPTGGLGLNADAHIIINQAGGATDGGVAVGVDGEVGVEDGLVSLNTNDDFAMGAPPGAPGAITETPAARPLILPVDGGRRRNTVDAPDVTPRAGFVTLPGSAEGTPLRVTHSHPTQVPSPIASQRTIRRGSDNAGPAPAPSGPGAGPRSNSNVYREVESGPYRDEDVLLALQLLAYLSKYPHVRQAFYKPRVTFHPASVNYTGARYAPPPPPPGSVPFSTKDKQKEPASSSKESQGFFRSITQAAAGSRGKERAGASTQPPTIAAPSSSQIRQTNVFSLVERFTFKPSSTETELPNPPPRLPPEIQYWAGVIMRNACRKDDSRGGIRQCANMLCGRWESYPREFAKCRRCRKAKYCGKECQSTAWSEGHRFWCSAKDADDDATGENISISGGEAGSSSNVSVQVASPSRAERRERHAARERGGGGGDGDTSTVRGSRPSTHAGTAGSSASTSTSTTVTSRSDAIARDRTLQPGSSLTAAAVRARNVRAAGSSNNSLSLTTQFDGQHAQTTIRRRGETTTPGASASLAASVPPNVSVPRTSLAQVDGLDRSIDPLEPGPSRRGAGTTNTSSSSSSSYRFPRSGGTDDDMVLG